MNTANKEERIASERPGTVATGLGFLGLFAVGGGILTSDKAMLYVVIAGGGLVAALVVAILHVRRKRPLAWQSLAKAAAGGAIGLPVLLAMLMPAVSRPGILEVFGFSALTGVLYALGVATIFPYGWLRKRASSPT